MGRPLKYDREEEARLILEWSKKEDSINLLGFSTEREYPAENLSVWANENPDFSKALRLTKQRIAVRREKMLNEGKLHNSTWQRNAAAYDTHLRDHEREQKEFESKLKQKELEVASMSLCDIQKGLDEGTIKQK